MRAYIDTSKRLTQAEDAISRHLTICYEAPLYTTGILSADGSAPLVSWGVSLAPIIWGPGDCTSDIEPASDITP
jgi:hypothetical protein